MHMPQIPYQATVDITVGPNFGGQNGFVTVPAGHTLVIEYVSGEAFLPAGQKGLFSILVDQGSGPVRHYLGANTTGTFGAPDYFWVSTPAKFYAKGGTQLDLRADRDIATGTATFRISISGYLEP